MKSVLFVFSMAILIAISSCKKDDKASKTELLSGKFWKVKAVSIDPSIPIVNDQGVVVVSIRLLADGSRPSGLDYIEHKALVFW